MRISDAICTYLLLIVRSSLSDRARCLEEADQNFRGVPGSEDLRKFAAPISSCRRACRDDPACEYFVHDEAHARCVLKRNFAFREERAGYTSGFPCCAVSRGQNFRGLLGAEDVEKKPAESAEQCASLCADFAPACEYYAFHERRGVCNLKRNFQRVEFASECSSGFRCAAGQNSVSRSVPEHLRAS